VRLLISIAFPASAFASGTHRCRFITLNATDPEGLVVSCSSTSCKQKGLFISTDLHVPQPVETFLENFRTRVRVGPRVRTWSCAILFLLSALQSNGNPYMSAYTGDESAAYVSCDSKLLAQNPSGVYARASVGICIPARIAVARV
jgi:hypothetical protein